MYQSTRSILFLLLVYLMENEAFLITQVSLAECMSTLLCSEHSGDESAPKAEYGVSYIGGDPCGSKYNDDPFDTQVQKPGMPDDMKARIQALVDKKVAEEKAAADRAKSSDGSSN